MSGGAAFKQENIFHLDCEQSKQKISILGSKLWEFSFDSSSLPSFREIERINLN